MLKIKLTLHGIVYGTQTFEWAITPDNCKGVSDTIKYLTNTPLKKIIGIELIPEIK